MREVALLAACVALELTRQRMGPASGPPSDAAFPTSTGQVSFAAEAGQIHPRGFGRVALGQQEQMAGVQEQQGEAAQVVAVARPLEVRPWTGRRVAAVVNFQKATRNGSPSRILA
jgi:hypothetical protein